MKLILNIGLDVNATQTIAARVAYEIVVANGFFIHQHKVVQSDTEPTLVVEVSEGFPAAPYRIAYDLHQDCIAVYNPTNGQGELLGPQSHKWGPFNPELFFLLDGTRLAQPAAKAA